MSVLFVVAGPIHFGSSRMRAWWPARHMADTEVTHFDDLRKNFVGACQTVQNTEKVIWQKWVDVNLITASPQASHWWDICDPMWWFSPQQVKEFLPFIAGVVVSSQALAEDFRKWSGRGCHVIPDRLELSHFPKQRQHADASPVRFVWFGMSLNRVSLAAAWANLERLAANGHAIALTIYDDRPQEELRWGDSFPVYHARWSLDHENEVLASHDIALLPPYPGSWGKVKSNNKAMTAWASGLPATTGECYEELEQLVVDGYERGRQAAAGLETVRRDYRVQQSADEWQMLLG